MAGAWDAEIKLLYPVEKDTDFVVDRIRSHTPFDVIAHVEIGEELNEFVDQHDLWISVRNLTTGVNVVTRLPFEQKLAPQPHTPYRAQIRIPIAEWEAEEGNVLQLIASYKVTAGANATYSSKCSEKFMVVA